MDNQLNLWKRLYELTNQITLCQPWNDLWSGEFICVQVDNKEPLYCTIMGRNKECIGVSVYEGEKGYGDLLSISELIYDEEVTKYMMFEQTCITFYMGNVDEVPPHQKQIMKKLGLRYRGKGKWPYFMSFEARYVPIGIEKEEDIKKMIMVFEALIDMMDKKSFQDVHFDDDEMLYISYDSSCQQWVHEPMVLPEPYDKFSPIELDDRSIIEELKKQSFNHQELYLDLVYIHSKINDSSMKRPLNALIFIVVDKQSEMILRMDLLNEDDDEIQIILGFFISYILNNGKMNRVFIRNPNIFASILDICHQCHIQIENDGMGIIDNIIYEMARMM